MISTAAGCPRLASSAIVVTTPGPGGGNSQAPTITGEQVLTFRKKNKKGKPVGKPVLQGFILDFSTAMNPATAGSSANYVVAAASTKRGKKKAVPTFNAGTHHGVYDVANHSVTLTLAGKQAFAQGGEITVNYAPPGGVSDAG